jgi:hypothetical protein
MKKYPSNQLDFDFNSPQPLSDRAGVKSSSLKLVHSRSETSQINNEASERERILAEAVAYARSLSW